MQVFQLCQVRNGSLHPWRVANERATWREARSHCECCALCPTVIAARQILSGTIVDALANLATDLVYEFG